MWTTEPLSTEATGTGTHTLSFKCGPGCKATVAGAALMRIRASSEAFDPLEDTIDAFRTLDAVKELAVKYTTRKLPPGIKDAVEAGVAPITDPSSDTYAAATGAATVTVGEKSASDTVVSRVVYKREDKEDKAIVGGGTVLREIFAADVQDGSLTSTLNATATLEAGAKGNGVAESTLESMYGTILAGFCECPDGAIIFRVLTDTGLLVKGKTAEATARLAMQDMQAAAEAVYDDLEDGTTELEGDALKERVEKALRAWADGIASDHFKLAE